VEDGTNTLFKRIIDASEFGEFAQDPISDQQKEDTSLVCINWSQAFT